LLDTQGVEMTAETLTPEGLYRRLEALGIAYERHDHAPVMTVEEAEAVCGHIPGVHCKNLFLKDAKDQLWLVTAPFDRRIDLKVLPDKMGSKRLSFGKPDLLLATLGVTPGSVTPLSIANDHAGAVTLVLDRWMMEQERLNFHPLINSATVGIAPADLLAFARASGHEPAIVDLR